MAHLSLSLLGRIEIALDGEPATGFMSDKVRALLAYLAVEGDRPHRRESLAGLLWPEWPESSARHNLRNALSNLRAVIGDREADPPFLLITRETIRFNPESKHELDVAQFESLAAGDSAEAWAEAAALYRGPCMEGFSLADSAPFEEWARLERERLERQTSQVLARLASFWEEQREWSQALGFARRQVELAPWDEAGHRAVMRLLALSGQRTAALVQYEECCRVLIEELDAEPSAETVTLYERIRAGELAEAGERKLAAPSPHNLPAFLTPLIGREQELAEITKRLADSDCRLLTLIGPGGSGKTRLAVEAAAKALVNFPDGVCFCSLAPLESVDAIVPAICLALGLSSLASSLDAVLVRSESEPWQRLLGYLKQKNLLLVVDNYEHLLDGAEIVARILATAPGVKVLVTSRASLRLSGEHLFSVPPLSLPDVPVEPPSEWHVIAATTEHSALQLFVSAAQRVWGDFELAAHNLTNVVRICQLVEGMPLGILLAAAWVKMLPPDEIAAAIGRGIDFLETDWRDLPARQRSMRAVFDHSWRLLGKREQEVMQALSVFRGSFAWQAAEEIAGTTLRDLMGLVDRSLLQRVAAQRYQLHELLRRYAGEKLAQTEDCGAAVRDRHAATYAAALGRWATDLRGLRQQEGLAEMDQERENILAAWNWAAERTHLEYLDKATEGLWLFFWLHHRRREGQAAFRTAADKLEAAEGTMVSPDGLRVRAMILAGQAGFCEGERKRQPLQESLALLDRPELAETDTRRERAWVLSLMGDVGDYSDRILAREMCERSLALCRELGDRWLAAQVMLSLGWVDYALGARAEARRWAEGALAIHRELGDAIGIAGALTSLRIFALYEGCLEESARLSREALSIWERIGTQHEVALAGLQGGHNLVLCGQFAEAAVLLTESLSVVADLGAWEHSFCAWLGAAKCHLGRYEESRVHTELGLAKGREIGWLDRIGWALVALSWPALARGDFAQADKVLRESQDVHRETLDRSDEVMALACLAYAARGLDRSDQAHECVRKALSTGVEFEAFHGLLLALPACALLLTDSGEMSRAVELYALASRYAFVANSQWFEDVAGKHIAAAAESLPSEVVSAAQERGRARDLWETARELLGELEAEQV